MFEEFKEEFLLDDEPESEEADVAETDEEESEDADSAGLDEEEM